MPLLLARLLCCSAYALCYHLNASNCGRNAPYKMFFCTKLFHAIPEKTNRRHAMHYPKWISFDRCLKTLIAVKQRTRKKCEILQFGTFAYSERPAKTTAAVTISWQKVRKVLHRRWTNEKKRWPGTTNRKLHAHV